jgi:hydroxymethylpyrimidine/phosphomethylpyrimidine kinase
MPNADADQELAAIELAAADEFPAARELPTARRLPVALTIAGSDSGGGAGIQADLKAFAACGVHGTCAITAITAQSTVAVSAIHPVPRDIVLAQVRAVAQDIGVDAVKVGMLGTAETIAAVAQALDELPRDTPVVVDPVMVAESGARLLSEDAEQALVQQILPRASVITPNLPEAITLLDVGAALGRTAAPLVAQMRETTDEEAVSIARALLGLGPAAVVLTGGHRERAVDLLASASADAEPIAIEGPRHPDGAAHGSGCTHSSVLAASLARGYSLEQAARRARLMAGEAVARGLREIGAGAGPVDVLNVRERGAGEREAG